MRSMNACMNSFCSASAAELYIYILPNANSGFLKIPVDFSVQSVIIGIYRKQRRSVHAKTAAVPSDLRNTKDRCILPQRVRGYRADPADAGRIRGHSAG